MKLYSALCATLALGLSLGTALADVRQGLVSYWPFESVTDTSPDVVYTNQLTLNNMDSSAVVAGERGQALSFNGTNQYLSLIHPENNLDSGLPIYSAKAYTIACWVKGSPGQISKVVFGSSATVGSSSPSAALLLINTPTDGSGKLSIVVRDTKAVVQINNVTSSGIVFDGQWHHVAWVDNNGQAKLFIDGLLDATTFNYTPSSLLMNITTVGGLAGNNYFQGSIDELGLWERALGQSEIQDVMTNGVQTPVPAFAPGANQLPANYTTTVGGRARFSVVPAGSRPLTLQWNAHGSPVAGATGLSLSLLGVTLSDAGPYSITISNAGGSYTSPDATLTVNADPAPNVNNGLLSYWPMDVMTNNTTPDLHEGNDLSLVNVSPADFTAGKYGSSLGVNGINSYASRVKGNSFYNTNAYTIAFWINAINGQTSGELFTEGSTNSNTPLFMLGTSPASSAAGGALDVFVRDDANITRVNHILSTNAVFDGTWHHVVWVDVNGDARLYIDGNLDAADFSYTASQLSANTTCVGALIRASVANYFFGNVDELAVWNRALTYTEINQIRTNGISPLTTPSGPIITRQPVSGTNTVDNDFSMSVSALGGPPLFYQWYGPVGAISGATSSSYTLRAAQLTDSGSYYVVVSNSVSSLASVTIQATIVPVAIPNLANITNGLMAYWPCDLVTSSNTTPDVFNGNDFTLVNMVATNLATGYRGSCLYFNGVNQYLRHLDATTPTIGLPLNSNKVTTISMWVKAAPLLAGRTLFAEGNTGSNTPLYLLGMPAAANSGVADLFIRNDANVTAVNHKASNQDLFDNGWHHLAFVDNNGTCVLYIDGVAQSTSFNYTKGTFSANTTTIGAFLRASGAGSFYLGYVDEVALWSRALSATEVSYVKNNGPLAPALSIPSIANHPPGSVQLNVLTPHPDWQHHVQVTTNLTPANWIDVTINLSQSGAFTLQANFTPDATRTHFYRAYNDKPAAYFSDNFEGASTAWTHNGTGDAWTRGTPTIGPMTAHSGVNCWGTGLNAAYSLNTAMHLVSPTVDLTHATNAWLQFFEYRDIQGIVSSHYVDYTAIYVYDAADPAGPPLMQLMQNNGVAAAWTKRALPLPAPIVGKQVFFDFVFTSGGSQAGAHAGWFVDDVIVVAYPY
ncbi:MAG: hypothetical protein JWQ71_4979 [Pedosphaera sp.]|nr:hypothetical protein [Pedosphaera sp.]